MLWRASPTLARAMSRSSPSNQWRLRVGDWRGFAIMERHDFEDFDALHATFPSADLVRNFIVFNIGGNKYR